MTNEPTHLDIFSGIGGFAIAAAWAGFRTVAFCEIEPYCQKVLEKNFGPLDAEPDSERLGETRECGRRPTKRTDRIRAALHSDIRRLDGTRYRGCDLLTAGFPCQPASCAGKRRGESDDRWLWPEALRVLGEAQPAFAVFENPTGLTTLERGLVFERILAALESRGYEVCPSIVIPARGVQADYYRYRVFVVAHPVRPGPETRPGGIGMPQPSLQPDVAPIVCADAQPERTGLSKPEHERQPGGSVAECLGRNAESYSEHSDARRYGAEPVRGELGRETGIFRVETIRPETHFELLRGIPGIPDRLDRNRRARIHALGNAVVPAQVFPILKAIRQLV